MAETVAETVETADTITAITPQALTTAGYRDFCMEKEMVEGSLEVKLPTIWRDEKQSRAEAERRGRLAERRSEEKE